MRLESIETFVTVPPTGIGGSFWVLVRVTTDDGIQGIGECYGVPFSGDVVCFFCTNDPNVPSRPRITAEVNVSYHTTVGSF